MYICLTISCIYPPNRYGCFLLQRLHSYLDSSDIAEVVEILERILKSQARNNDYSSTDQGGAESLERRLTRNLSADVLTAPVPLTQFPIVGSFRPKLFPLHIRPYRTTGSVSIIGGVGASPPS